MDCFRKDKKIEELQDEIDRLRGIIGDLLWAIGHDNEQELNSATLRAKAALELCGSYGAE
jgi:ElaB/YqjD/DUF883 family membrane-anchored ribosome-binding protein